MEVMAVAAADTTWCGGEGGLGTTWYGRAWQEGARDEERREGEQPGDEREERPTSFCGPLTQVARTPKARAHRMTGTLFYAIPQKSKTRDSSWVATGVRCMGSDGATFPGRAGATLHDSRLYVVPCTTLRRFARPQPPCLPAALALAAAAAAASSPSIMYWNPVRLHTLVSRVAGRAMEPSVGLSCVLSPSTCGNCPLAWHRVAGRPMLPAMVPRDGPSSDKDDPTHHPGSARRAVSAFCIRRVSHAASAENDRRGHVSRVPLPARLPCVRRRQGLRGWSYGV